MRFELLVSLRYLRSKQKERFISLITFISVTGVALGVAALIVVLSVMSGFDHEIKEKIIGTYSHVIIFSQHDSSSLDTVTAKLKGMEEVVSFSPFVQRQALLKTKENIAGVLIRGIDPEKEGAVTNIKEFTGKQRLDLSGDGIIIGSELKRSLNLSIGDSVSVISPKDQKSKEFKVVDVFNSGRYDYDTTIAIITIDGSKELFGENCLTGIGVKVKDEFDVGRIKNILQIELGYPYIVKTWADLDRNLMRALAVEKKMMFFILALIVIVACFNIASTLIMVVMEKTKDIGILKSIGATSSSIRKIFLMNGFLMAFIGIIAGCVAGFVFAANINGIADGIERFSGFSLFPSDVYYLDRIPVRIESMDVFAVVAVAIFISLAAALYPAWQAARLDPVKAIRYE
ncbi:MAG: lipoprotein-releasing system transmembrane subunit LolC [Candidatus Omnitrophica bacterium CG07_land_8_20_14_0_80_42_15]|uniref:Lipoprotein-releasing system transmembrane subunit LolC n=1 Tax=Candidatus Aquitaenariimonas noxiae TaxID=1974741 RepID=A0A2J0L6H9_9BACT|nr:MAG: lipoprotein-releasing system transmembrane subunit LolC [Candidatus Omnitrophica bacterium CG07_land_8_20_14_0_80_42_15]